MSETITEFNIYKIKQEILNKFRYSFNSLDTQSRVTEKTTTFDGTGSQSLFLLSAAGMSYVKSVTVGGTPLTFGADWDIEWRGTDVGKVNITTPPIVGTDNVSIVWGDATGSSNFVYSDWARSDTGVHSYPRIGFKTTVAREITGLCGAGQVISNDVLLQIKVLDTNTFNIDYTTAEIDAWILANAKDWYYFNFVTAQNIAEYDNYDDNVEETQYKIVEYIIPRKLQKVSYT